MAVQALCSILLWSSVPRGQALEWAEFPGLGPFIPVPLVSKEFPPAISEWCIWKLLGKAGIHTSPCVGQELPGPACTRGWDAVSRLQRLFPEICFREALLS